MIDITGPVHLVGIGGIHMSAIAQLLMEQGVTVSGSDQRLSPLTDRLVELGATVREGHAAANLPASTRLVVTTSAAATDNPEIVAAKERGIPVVLRAEMVARLMEGKKVIAVAGSAGKTTTASLLAYILKRAGKAPMYLLGGESLDLEGHAAWGDGEYCVVEADEFNNAFHEYAPHIGIITNVQADHLDFFGTVEAYHQSFETFARKVQPGGTLLISGEDPGARQVIGRLTGVPFAIEDFGLSPRQNWMAGTPLEDGGRVLFELLRQGRSLGQVTIPRPGMHMILNGLAAASAATLCGVSFGDIRKACGDFKGAKRRFEFIGEAGGVVVYDDYAHHPAKVTALLEAARVQFGARRIIGIYQPHTYTRTDYLWDDWLTCFAGLDALIVVETFAARETPKPGRTASDLARALTNPAASYAPDFASAAQKARDLVRPGDVVFTIGAGDANAVGPMLLELLK